MEVTKQDVPAAGHRGAGTSGTAGSGAPEVHPVSPVGRRVTGPHHLGMPAPGGIKAGAVPAGVPPPAVPLGGALVGTGGVPAEQQVMRPGFAGVAAGDHPVTAGGDATLPPGWVEAAAEQCVAQWLSDHPDAPRPRDEGRFWPDNNTGSSTNNEGGAVAALPPAGPDGSVTHNRGFASGAAGAAAPLGGGSGYSPDGAYLGNTGASDASNGRTTPPGYRDGLWRRMTDRCDFCRQESHFVL
jgi:hypothetical protein